MKSTDQLIMLVTERALTGAEQMPTRERAELFDGIALVLEQHSFFTQEADAARAAARQLREADAAQLLFRALMSSAVNKQPKGGQS